MLSPLLYEKRDTEKRRDTGVNDARVIKALSTGSSPLAKSPEQRHPER